MRRLLLLMIVLLSLLLTAGERGEARPLLLPRIESQRVEVLGQLGGLVTAGIPLKGSLAVMAEGPSLVLLDLAGSAPTVHERLDLAHGMILDMVRVGDLFFALTEDGVVTLVASGEGLPQPTGFAPGSGQALAALRMPAGGVVLALAAREAGLRVLRADAQGHLSAPALLPLPGTASDVALSADGSRAFVAAGEAGVHLVEVSDPLAPRWIGTLTVARPAGAVEPVGALLAVADGARIVVLDPTRTDEDALIGIFDPLREGRRIIAQGEFVYVADVRSGLKILWRAAPDRLVQVYGESRHPARDLWVEGDLAYVVGSEGLRILNVGNRYRPLEIARLPLPGEPQGLAVAPPRAFVALGDEGIAVVDIENLSQPRLRRRISVVRGARAAALHQDTLYVAAGERGLAVIDPAAPGVETLLGSFTLPGPALDLARRGDVLYVAGGEAGLVALDISRPEAPLLAGVLPAEAGRGVSSVTADGKRAYLAEGDGFSVADVSSPYALGRLAWVDVPAEHIASDEETLYVLGGNQIAIYDAGATAEPLPIRVYRGMGAVSDLAALGNRLLVSGAGDSPGLVILGLLSPDYPLELDSIPEDGVAYRAWPAGNEVWLARGYGGLRRYAITEGGALLARGGYTAIPAAGRLAQGDTQMLVGGHGGWSWLTLAEDGLPFAAGPAFEGLPVSDLALAGDAVAIAAGDRGVALYTLAGASAPTQVALRQTRGAATAVALDDGFVYVADAGGLSIFDRHYLQSVVQVSTPAPANDLVLHNGRAYLPLNDGRLAIIALGDPTGGLHVRSSVSTRRPHALIPSPDGHSVYGLADDRLIRVLVGDPRNLAITQTGQLAAPAERGFFNGGLLWAITSGEGLRLYDLSLLDFNSEAILRGQISAAVQDVVAAGTMAYVAYGAGGLGLLDLTTRRIAPPFYSEEVRALYREDGVLFAAGQALTAWDIATPTDPVLLATLPLPARGRHIAPGGEGRLLLSLESGLAVVEWDDAELRPIGLLTLPGGVDRAVQMGKRAYLALHRGGLLPAEMSDPTHPSGLFSYTSPSGQFVRDLLPLDANTLLVSWEGGVDALDVSAPAAGPRLLDAPQVAQTPLLDMTLSTDGSRAALALGTEGVLLLDMSPDGVLQTVGFADTPGAGLRTALSGPHTLFVADGLCGLRVLDISDPSDPREQGYWRSGYASDVSVRTAAQGDLIYLAESTQLLTLRYDADAPPALPPVPQFAAPTDGQGDVALSVKLAWGPPPDPCNPLRYDVYLGLSNPPPLLGRAIGEPVLEVSDLLPLRTYYWRVVAVDQQGDRVEGPLWHFTTARADFAETLFPSPPPLVERLRHSPLIPAALIVFAAGAAIATWLIWRIRRQPSSHEPHNGE